MLEIHHSGGEPSICLEITHYSFLLFFALVCKDVSFVYSDFFLLVLFFSKSLTDFILLICLIKRKKKQKKKKLSCPMQMRPGRCLPRKEESYCAYAGIDRLLPIWTAAVFVFYFSTRND